MISKRIAIRPYELARSYIGKLSRIEKYVRTHVVIPFAKFAHFHIAKRPHQHLASKEKLYYKWHNHPHHAKVHFAILGTYVIAVIAVGVASVNHVYALTVWNQSDWSGGVGVSTDSQYESASNVDSSVEGQVSLAKTSNAFSNSSFDSDTTGWSGRDVQYQTSEKYSGNGASQINAGSISSDIFYSAETYTNTANQTRVVAGDLNGDSRDEVIVSGADGIYVYSPDSEGTLGAAVSYAGLGGARYYDVAVSDFNGDGDLDVVATLYATQGFFSVYLNDGDGGLTRADYAFGSNFNHCSVVPVDINSDDFDDLAFACYGQSSLHYTLNNQSGAFPTVTSVSGLPRGLGDSPNIVSGDFNGDGKADVALSSYSGAICDFSYSLSNGNTLPSVQTHTYVGCDNNYSDGLAAGDINADGRDDIALARRSQSEGYYVTTLQGGADGTFSAQQNIPGASVMGYIETELELVDYNSDGNLDISSTNQLASTRISYFKGNGDGTFDPKVDYTGGTASIGSHTSGSLRGDGRKDIITIKQPNATPEVGISVLPNRSIGDTISQSYNAEEVQNYLMEGYVRNGTGGVVDSSVAQLIVDGYPVDTVYSETATPGWYKLSARVNSKDKKIGYGVIAKQGKTIYVDDMLINRYASSGTLTSNIFDTSTGSAWGTLTFSDTTPVDTTASVKVRAGNSADLSDASSFQDCSTIISGSDFTGGCSLDNKRYVQYQIMLATTDSSVTPTFSESILGYSAYDNTTPTTNASTIIMKKAAGGASVSTNDWSNGATPYFSWTSGVDDEEGSGIKGYCLYLGQDNTADPVSTKGNLGISPLDTSGACQFAVSGNNVDLSTVNYIGTALASSNSSYYLNVKAIDNANNVYAGSSAQFQFRFDGTPPTNPTFISAPSQFVATKDVTLTWLTNGGSAASDVNSGIAGLQYSIGSEGVWYGDSHTGAEDETDILPNSGSYTTVDPIDYDELKEGNNIVYFRTYDVAGNVSPTHISTVIKLNTTSPSAPQNVSASPTTNSINSFSFAWIAPVTFQGAVSNITYCYTVNTLPTANNCTFTGAGQTSLASGAYATQPGENTLYVVAKDEAGNINYATAATTTFTANTSAPGVPLSPEIADISTKSTASWKLALSWSEPTDMGAGVNSYRIFRSADNIAFSQIASTSGTSYVDGNVSQFTYYYKVKACDSANNCGAFSGITSKKPTGRFTTPAELVTNPSVEVSTRSATIVWATERDSDSRVQIGTERNQYAGTESANSEQTKNHKIELNNLSAGTTYYYKAVWTDEDGNKGITSELSFTTLPAPTIKDVTVRRVTLNTGVIQFVAKNAAAVNLVYGQSDGFGGLKKINTSTQESTYTVELDGLEDGTKYFYKINTVDVDGNQYDSGRIDIFTTPARPRISNLRFQPVEGEPTSTQSVSWQTNVPTTSLVRYEVKGGSSKEIIDSALVSEHVVVMKGLLDDSTYNLVAESRDKDNNLAISDNQTFKTALDTRSPKITDFQREVSIRGVGTEASGQVVVSWKTDEPATSQVAYGEGVSGGTYPSTTAEDRTLTTEHTVIISDLTTSQVYHLQPISYDKVRNETRGEDKSVIIGEASDSVFDIIFSALEGIFGL